jgi:hypothetical protein
MESKSNPNMISLKGSEYSLYTSGIRRGHAECLDQLANQLREATAAAKQNLRTRDQELSIDELLKSLDEVLAGYEQFAKQLEEPAKQARAEHLKLLEKFCVSKSLETRTLGSKLKAAMKGALGGWRSG